MNKFKISSCIQSLSKQHQDELSWFRSFKSINVLHKDIPNRNFSNTPKGIYVPKNNAYCLAAKKTLGDDYSDRDLLEPFFDSKGGWFYEYSPEKHEQGMTYYTNNGMLKSSKENIPIGFIFQTHNKKSNPAKITSYDVLGLALVRYDGGNNIFKLYGFNNDEVVFIPN